MTENETLHAEIKELRGEITALRAVVEGIEIRLHMRAAPPRQHQPPHPFHLLDRVAKIPDDVAVAMAKVVPGRVGDL